LENAVSSTYLRPTILNTTMHSFIHGENPNSRRKCSTCTSKTVL